MAEALHQFGQIYLGGRGGVSQGQLKVTPSGFTWRRVGGGTPLEVKKDDVSGLVWSKVPRGCQLGVQRTEGATVNFLGFRDSDYESLARFCQSSFGLPLVDQPVSVSGRNWGSMALVGSSLNFMVDSKVAFQVPLPDVSQAQQAKDEVMLEFHVDDTAAGDKEDTLVEMAFHVPPSYDTSSIAAIPPEGSTDNAAKLLVDALLQHTDAGAATSDDAVAIFDDVAVLMPRGRFEVEMHSGFLKMVGQTQDFKIRYTSIVRLFILPKSSTPHTLVVISLDPPIRKGQTYYSHLLCQFDSEQETAMELDISDELLAAKNEKCGGKLSRHQSGPLHEVFARALRGLSGAKLTRPGGFRAADGDSCAVRCSYKADDGFLYPLERAFFYIHKPPLLVLHDDIDSVEFARQGGGVLSSSVRTFDLLVRLRNGQELQFRNIQRTEWQGLFNFIHEKRIRVENLASAKQGPGGPGVGIDLGDEPDAGMRAAAAEAEDESDDEDFEAGSGGSSSSGGGSDAGSDPSKDASDSSDAELIDEEGIDATAISGKKRKAPAAAAAGGEPKPKAPKKPRGKAAATAAAVAGGDAAAGAKQRKPRKKKDPNAPKKALSAFMYFSNANRDRIKAENPGIPFGQVGKLLGEQWKALSAEQKVQYDQMAAKDKERYAGAMADYKASSGGGAGAGGGGGEDDWGSDQEEGGEDE